MLGDLLIEILVHVIGHRFRPALTFLVILHPGHSPERRRGHLVEAIIEHLDEAQPCVLQEDNRFARGVDITLKDLLFDRFGDLVVDFIERLSAGLVDDDRDQSFRGLPARR